jgi:hypothetical protein
MQGNTEALIPAITAGIVFLPVFPGILPGGKGLIATGKQQVDTQVCNDFSL